MDNITNLNQFKNHEARISELEDENAKLWICLQVLQSELLNVFNLYSDLKKNLEKK